MLATVSASDVDQGSNGVVTYSLYSAASATLFDIGQYDGVLLLTGNVDYEKNKHYQIAIQASDQGGHTDSCKVIIDVTDTNDQ